MDFKRIVIFSGHYGSGKTNIAVNVAHHLKKTRPRVAIADIDIVNPYFRTEDSREELSGTGIRLITSPFAGSNVVCPPCPTRYTPYRTISPFRRGGRGRRRPGGPGPGPMAGRADGGRRLGDADGGELLSPPDPGRGQRPGGDGGNSGGGGDALYRRGEQFQH